MAWWRRDPSLWCRSALHRYSRLGDRTDALRSRCFSKSQVQAAQHKDDDDAQRPSGLSDMQWIQLQHYRRWRRRLQDNPYRALFGASEDMLNGKGLRDWEWVSKAFPKWMLRDMGIDEWGGQAKFKPGGTSQPKPASDPPAPSKTREDKTSSVEDKSQNKVNSSPNGGTKTRVVMPTWEDLLENYTGGVVSPSDSRRPVESPPTREELIDDLFGHRARKTPPRMDSHLKQETKAVATGQDAKETSVEAAKRETTFIKEFLHDSPKAIVSTEDKSNTWRQTSIDRRANGSDPQAQRPSTPPAPPSVSPDDVSGSESISQPNANSSRSEVPITPVEHPSDRFWPAMSSRGQSPGIPTPIPSSQSAGDHQAKSVDSPSTWNWDVHSTYKTVIETGKRDLKTGEWSHSKLQITQDGDEEPVTTLTEHPDLSIDANDKATVAGAPDNKSSRSTSEVLSQLPKDDLDFLSAEEIRASMGVKKSTVKSTEEKHHERKELEEQFKHLDSQAEELKLDDMLQSRIINDQLVRRTERELNEEAAQSSEVNKTEQSNASKPEAKVPGAQPPIETSMDRMTRWLKTSGDAINRNFWQEPSQKAQVDASSDSFLKGIVSGVEKSRGTMELVREDLEKDLPCSKPLLQRLQDNEASIIPRAGKLARYQQDAFALNNALRARSKVINRVKQLRAALEMTEEEYENARKELEAKGSKVMYPSKDRLRKAFELLQKNVRLSRRMFFGLQARLETIGSAPLTPMYIDMGHRLLALRDTQFALLRLVECAMQTFDVSVEPQFRSNSYAVNNWTDVLEKTSSPQDVVANQKLNDEIEAQKSAMQGLSDDGYSRAPKAAKKSTFAAESPLAHSLFRPFGEQIESLGKEEAQSKPAEDTVVAKSRQQAEDRALVSEVKKAYEDTYSPITMTHQQMPEEEHTYLPNELNRARNPEIIAPEEGEKMMGSLKDLARQGLITVNVDPPASTGARIEATSFPEQPPPYYSTVTEGEVRPLSDETFSVPSQEATSTSVSETETVTEPETTTSVTESQDRFEPISNGHIPFIKTTDLPPSISSDSSNYQPASVTPSTPITHTVLTYNPSTDEVSVITTTSHSPEELSESVPISKAFRCLEYPAKFLPHLPQGFNITAVSKNSLILRESDDPTTIIQSITTHSDHDIRDDDFKHTVNPVDGTARLSPTGYSGVDDLKEEVGRELDAIRRREAAERIFNQGKTGSQLDKTVKDAEKRREKKRSRSVLGSVLKTAIVGGTICYIFGVIGEIAS